MNTTLQIIDRRRELEPDQRIYVSLISQVSLTVTGENRFREVQERALKWLFDPKRNLRGIPNGAWEGESFEIDTDSSEKASAIKLVNPKYWTVRLSEQHKDPGRIWITEIGIAERSPTQIVFGCRVLCSQRGAPEAMPRSIPAFVRGIAFRLNAELDGRAQSAEPWIVRTANDADELIVLIESPRRRHPIVAFATPEDSYNEAETAFPVSRFVRKTIGFVHSVIVMPEAAYRLTDILGKDFSVYRQAVRTYYPSFDASEDLSTDHPVATAQRIRQWNANDGQTFEDFLVYQSLRITRPRQELERDFPPYHQVKRVAAELARQSAANDGKTSSEDLLILADEEIAAAKREAKETLELLTEAEREREDALSRVREIQSSYLALQARVGVLQRRTEERGDQPELAHPNKLQELESWSIQNLSGSVELADRALKAARECDFQNTALVFDALLLMRDYYVPMRREGGKELVRRFETRLAELGLENSKCFSQPNKAQNFGGEYFVKYQGKKRELDWHLKGSNSRDGRLGFRIYYFWDTETSRVIVGYLPGHLTNDGS
jgi:hypothetical protein